MNPATSELVSVAWLKTIPGITINGMVSTQLPADSTSWATNGFIRVGPIVGGTPQAYVPIREPVVQLDTYAVNLNSDRPRWDLANYLAELVMAACYDNVGIGDSLVTRTGHRNAVVLSARPIIEPRRVYDDPTSYGHFQLDIALMWREVDE